MAKTQKNAEQIMAEALREAVKKAGGKPQLASKIGISPQALGRWKRVPFKRAKQIAIVTGVPVKRLAADLFEDIPELETV